jgi:hypothetical protein
MAKATSGTSRRYPPVWTVGELHRQAADLLAELHGSGICVGCNLPEMPEVVGSIRAEFQMPDYAAC